MNCNPGKAQLALRKKFAKNRYFPACTNNLQSLTITSSISCAAAAGDVPARASRAAMPPC